MTKCGSKDHCGFTLQPEDMSGEVDENIENKREWHLKTKAVCCVRRTIENGDRCIWHTDVNGKSIEDIQEQEILTGERLDGAKLQNMALNNKIAFSECWLIGANFRNTDLSESTLDQAVLAGSILEDATLKSASLIGTDLRGATLADASLTNAELTNADLSDSFLESADLSNTYLKGADFSNAFLYGANLKNASFYRSNAFNADFPEADLTNTSLFNTNFSRTNLQAANLSNATFIGVDFTDGLFTAADITNTEFISSDLTGASLSGVDLSRAMFSQSKARWTDFSQATLESTDLTDSDLVGADFEGAILKDAILDGATLYGVRFYDAKLHGTSINHRTNFSRVTIYEQEANQRQMFDGNTTIPSAPAGPHTKFNLAVRSGAALNRRTETTSQGRIDNIIRRVKESGSWLRNHWTLSATKQYDIVESLDKAINVYRSRQRLHRENSQPADVEKPYIREKHSRRKRAFVNGDRVNWLKYSSFRWIMLYGESPTRVVGTSLVVILLFAIAYPLLGGVHITSNPATHTFFDPFNSINFESTTIRTFLSNVYFSTVTFSTLGYGGIQPATSATKFLASLQSLIGNILMALLVAVFARRALR